MKSKRQEKILEIIRRQDVETQEQLLAALSEAGFPATQATISRDIRQLRIVKQLGPNGVYRYQTADAPAAHQFSDRLNVIFKQSITSVDHAQNILVIKTMSGMASAAMAALDAMHISEVVGTLAGDDTAFVVLRDTPSAANLCAELRRQVGAK